MGQNISEWNCLIEKSSSGQRPSLATWRARVAICSQIALYNLEKPGSGARLLPLVLVRTLTVKGFLVFQYADRYGDAFSRLAKWHQEGKLKYRETVAEGIENAASAFLRTLRGEDIGKQSVRISNL
jgi:NADPH-dependent curcumin reductase CurA